MTPTGPVLRVAVLSPLRALFDYLPPPGVGVDCIALGARVRVPFGRGTRVGVVLARRPTASVSAERLKAVLEVLDPDRPLPAETLRLLEWAWAYYHHPAGEVLETALPAALRRGRRPEAAVTYRWRLTAAGYGLDLKSLRRASRQVAILRSLAQRPEGIPSDSKLLPRRASETLRGLAAKGWAERQAEPCLCAEPAQDSPLSLNAAQHAAVETVTGSAGFQVFLLEGVTGSGKTEVYLRLVSDAVARGHQALVLLPEIGLTHQTVERFRRRLPVPVAVLHSGLADQERLCAWCAARDGDAGVVIGTRSAVFVPLARPGIFIVDEEHDASFKQQDGFRYSGRDLAVVRARQAGVPVILGSATPALESLYNALRGRYRRLLLPDRAGGARHPAVEVLDVRRQPLQAGLSEPLIAEMTQTLSRGEQVLLFLNRRGYAPALLCHECGWVAGCRRCDAHLTVHRRDRRLRCHHCGAEEPLPARCPQCTGPDLQGAGQGTERLEQALAELFPAQEVLRVDRDTTRRKHAFRDLLEQVHSGSADILVGTQMLAKGHHFPSVTLVGIVDADRGLFSVDFRAPERMAQLIVQVAGRAGRADKPGRVLIQTHHPDHPLLGPLIAEGYAAFAEAALRERAQARLPPETSLALLRAEAPAAPAPMAFLGNAAAIAAEISAKGVELLGPVAAPMERRAGRYRAQLLVQSRRRSDLQRFLRGWVPRLDAVRAARRVRWSLDVDPVELY
jgi:primosomal protein N' (replication factor Y) (superfamily II helicase)